MEKKDIETSSYTIGLTKVIGKAIKEIHGYTSTEYDDPVFKLCKVEFEDGTFLGCEGEHDFPYLVKWGMEGVTENVANYDKKIEEAHNLTKEDEN